MLVGNCAYEVPEQVFNHPIFEIIMQGDDNEKVKNESFYVLTALLTEGPEEIV